MIKKIDQQKMQEHLRELSKLAMKANIKHHTVIDKHATHARDLMKMLKEERASNQRLKNIISYKDDEIDELNKKNTDQLWELAKMEQKIHKHEEVAAGVAHYEKKIKEYVNKESVDN